MTTIDGTRTVKSHGAAALLGIGWLFAMLVAGCNTVTTLHPLSEEPAAIDQEKLEGVWLFDTTPLTLMFGSNGVAQIAGVQWKNNQFNFLRMEAVVTEGKQNNFMSIRVLSDETGSATNQHLLIQYTFVNNQGDILLWSPNVTAFKDAIRSKQLQGTVGSNAWFCDTFVTNMPADLLKFVDQPDNPRLFNYSSPVVLRRICGPDKDNH